MKTKTLFVSSAVALFTALSVSADVREGLVAYWPLDTGTGAYPMTTPDVVGGNNMTGPFSDAAYAFVPGHAGNAMTFEGAFSYLTFQAPTGSDTGLPVSKKGSWTMCMWVNANPQTLGNYYFVESSSSSASPLTAFTVRANTNNTAIYVRDASGNNPVNFPTVTNVTLDGTWHHVAMTYDAATSAFRHYVDGSLVYTNAFTPNYSSSSLYDLVNLGARLRNGATDLWFAGSVDDVGLWARTLSQAEVQAVKATGIATPVPLFPPGITVNPKGATNLYPGDNYTLRSFSYGSRPLYYQWQKDGVGVPGETTDTLALASVTTATTGGYALVVTNSSGSVTSAVAQITVNGYAAPNLTNGIVAYWPLNTIVGTKTPDLVSAYDLTLFGSTAPTIVAGKWGNAMSFTASSSQYASRTHNAGDALPAYARTNFTVSLWAKGPYASSGGWVITESSSANNFPAFAIGMKDNAAASPFVDTFLRDNSGNPSGLHIFSGPNTVWDDNWHNVVYVQHDAGGVPVAKVYVDGLPDQSPAPRYPITPNRTSLGAYVRGTANGFITALVDEVVIWERVLSPDEIALLPGNYITNPPSRLSPLAVNSFKADFPGVAQGDATVLRWDVPANATQVLISGLGDVTSKTVAGVGSTNISPSTTTTYVLTVKRAAEQATATTTVLVASGVAANWSLLDNFDSYSPGTLATNGWWTDVGGGSSVSVVANSCNRMAQPVTTTAGAYLQLKSLTVNSNQARTLFFRMIPTVPDASETKNQLGLTDRLGNFDYQYKGGNIGPAVYPGNTEPSQNPGDWLLAAINMPFSPLTFDTHVLQVGEVYNVWIDVTNVFIGDRLFPDNCDVFSVYLQKEGDVGRTAVFTDFISDRDLMSNDPLTGGQPTDPLTRLYLMGNRSVNGARFDDFYLSKSGYNATIPRAAGYTGPVPTLQIQKSGNQWVIVFQGKLLEASSITGIWSEVTGATSPYPLPIAGDKKFFRAVCY